MRSGKHNKQMATRIHFNYSVIAIFLMVTIFSLSYASGQKTDQSNHQPNIIVILTDDQGFGDVGFHGNSIIKTPQLDRMASEGIDFKRFYVAPVCSPTRAGILTGRWHYRTGVTNVGSCGDRIKADEVILAEVLRQAGYATAVYGKWHLGDNYPIRPQDMGFEETVIHKGCCLTPWFRNDPPGENYFDPWLLHNGKKKQYQGYCMDVFTDLAMAFAEENADENKPFFIYLSANNPHGPLNVSDAFSRPYRENGLSRRDAEYYGTITNIDYNIGRLLDGLKDLGLDENTLMIFLSDNGGTSGSTSSWGIPLRGRKATVYEGGIRVPCVFRWPGVIKAGTKTERIACYVDLMPTLLDAAGVSPPSNIRIDGVSLMPLLTGDPVDYPDRTLIIQWHQGMNPQLYRSFTVINHRFKLVQAVGGFQQSGKYLTGEYTYELFDLIDDPQEKYDLSDEYPAVLLSMKKQYETWFWDVINSRGPDPQEIFIGSERENPCRLMASGSFVEQDQIPNKGVGEWPSRVLRDGIYDIELYFHNGLKSDGKLHFKFGKVKLNKPIKAGAREGYFRDVSLKKGSDWLEGYVRSECERKVPTYIDITYKGI